MLAREARAWQAAFRAPRVRAPHGGPDDETAQRRLRQGRKRSDARLERRPRLAVPRAHQLRKGRRPRRPRELLRRRRGALELIERQPQPSEPRIAREREQQLDLAQAPAEGARGLRRRRRRRELHRRLDHGGAPALTIALELAARSESRRGQVPHGDVDQSREACGRREPRGRKQRAELAGEWVARASLRGALALLSPPREARVGDLGIEAGAETLADLAWWREECERSTQARPSH